MQLKLTVRKMRKEGKLEAAAGLPGANRVYPETLLALMDHSRQGTNKEVEERERIVKEMKDEGMFVSTGLLVVQGNVNR